MPNDVESFSLLTFLISEIALISPHIESFIVVFTLRNIAEKFSFTKQDAESVTDEILTVEEQTWNCCET